MSELNRDELPFAHAPVLDPALLKRIHELNLDYVELLIAEYVASGRSAYFLPLPAAVLEALMCLSRDQRRALASTTYTLYCVSFENLGFWREANDLLHARPASARYDAAAIDPPHGAFCEVALFLAWHVCVAHPTAARVLYAIPQSLGSRLAAMPLWSLRHLAMNCVGLLTPRWPANPCFWPDLVHFAGADDWERLSAAQLLGNQLISAELERLHRAERRAGTTAAAPPQRRSHRKGRSR